MLTNEKNVVILLFLLFLCSFNFKTIHFITYEYSTKIYNDFINYYLFKPNSLSKQRSK